MIEYLGLDNKIHNTHERTCYHCQSPIMEFGDLPYREYNDGTFLHERCIHAYLLEQEMQEENYQLNRDYENAELYREDY
jgi:hypothetical protein